MSTSAQELALEHEIAEQLCLDISACCNEASKRLEGRLSLNVVAAAGFSLVWSAMKQMDREQHQFTAIKFMQELAEFLS